MSFLAILLFLTVVCAFMHKKNWDDFRVVLAVCEAGSVNGAGKLLGLNHATILRRVAAFEARHGVSIFTKSAKGYQLNSHSMSILASLRSLDNAVDEVERRLQGHESRISGVVRITSTDSFCDWLLPDLIAELCENQQDLQVTLIATNQALDLDKTQADIALRAAPNAPEGLINDGLDSLGLGVYQAKGLGQGDGQDQAVPQKWVRRAELSAGSAIHSWQEEIIGQNTVVAQADTFTGLAGLVRAGVGAGMLPCLLGDRIDTTERIMMMPENMRPQIWLACHKDMIDLPHIRTTYDFLRDGLARRRAELTGQVV